MFLCHIDQTLFLIQLLAMTEKNERLFSRRDLGNIYIPILIETLLTVTVGVADTMMVAQAGEAAVSGVSCFNTIQNFLIALFSAFATGGSVVVSQMLGMKNRDRAKSGVRNLMYLTVLASLALTIVFLFLREPLLRLIYGQSEEAVILAAKDYALPIVISLVFLASQSSLNAILRVQRKTRTTMWTSIAANVINIAGNAIFILVFHMGALGVGIATLISRIVASLILLFAASRKDLPSPLEKFFTGKKDGRMMGTIFSIALPSGLENSIFQLGKIVMIASIAQCGTASMAAFSVLDNIGTFANITGQAAGQTLMVTGGYAAGAGRFDESRRLTRTFLLIAYLSMAAIALVIVPLLRPLISLYSFSPETAALSYRILLEYMVWSTLVWPVSFTFPNILKSSGDVKFTMYTAVLSMWIFRVMFARILGIRMGFGIVGIMWGMYVDWVVRAVAFIIRYKSGRWTEKRIREE